MAFSVSSHDSTRAGPRRDAASRLRIVVSGYVVRGPIGGMAWHHMQYALGLARLGHDVLYIEDSDDYSSCYDPSKHVVGFDPTYGLRFAKQAFDSVGLTEHWAYHDAHTGRWLGPAADRAIRFCDEADVLLNVSGMNPVRGWLENIPLRVLIDTDPFFTQVRHLTDTWARRRAAQHNAFFSFGELIADEGDGRALRQEGLADAPSGQSQEIPGPFHCAVPDDGFAWQPTRQPVVLDVWPKVAPPARGAFTTVMQWDSYPAVTFEGQRFGMKRESFDRVCELPRSSPVPLEIALGGEDAPRPELEAHGWRLVNPLEVTRDLWTYQQYLHSSRGEFSVAKHGYVASRCGWFSDRSACYLASGRPVVVQDTGFSKVLPCGRGLSTFDDAESALDALRRVEAEYRAHCSAARDLAGEYFDAGKVLEKLLERSRRIVSKTPAANTDQP